MCSRPDLDRTKSAAPVTAQTPMAGASMLVLPNVSPNTFEPYAISHIGLHN